MRRFVLAVRPFVISIVAVTALATPAFAQNPPNVVNGSNSASGNSWVAGAQGGYNFQTGSAVYGFETDFSFINLQSSMSGGLSCFSFGSPVACSGFPPTPSANTSSSVDWYGTVRGRLGWTTGPLLLYGTGGLAYGKVDLNSNFGARGLVTELQTSSVRTGWVLGGGIDYMVRPNVMVNLGYQYVDLGSVSAASSANCSGSCFVTQNASARAQFQVVMLGLNWKFTPTNAGSGSWEGGYIGGHGGGAWGNNTNANYSAGFFSCFTGATQILMADGTIRAIAAVKIGDEVLGENGEVNRVVDIETPLLGKRKLYAFNEGIPFVTAEHPFMTKTGWKSISPEITLAENKNLSVGALKAGDEVLRLDAVMKRPKSMTVGSSVVLEPPVGVSIETKFLALDAVVSHDSEPSTIVYNLRLNGNHTYFANDYLVHNK